MSLGQDFAEALARKDFAAIEGLLHPEIDFRAMTPRLLWEQSTPQAVITGVLREWFDDGGHIEELVSVDSDAVGDTERVGYRFRVRNAKGEHLVEQQAYLRESEGRIGWLRIMCSGFRPTS